MLNVVVIKKEWWICSENHEYEQKVYNRTSRNLACPYCSGHKVGYGNDLKTLNPNLAKQWHQNITYL